ncbi:hypothetical protein Tco_1353627 [Tanacetum coccineum]
MITSFYQNRSFNPPYNYPNAFHNSPTGLYRPTMESSMSSQPNQPYSPINPTNLDMNFEELIFSQDYNYSQDIIMGHGSRVKASRRAARAKQDEPKDAAIEVEQMAGRATRCTLKKNLVHQEVMTRSLANGKLGFTLELVLFAPSSIMLKRIMKVGRKNSKTSETTSGSTSGGLNLNEEADEAVEETQEFQPIGHDRS